MHFFSKWIRVRGINEIKISDSYWLTGTEDLTHQGLKDLGEEVGKAVNGLKNFLDPFFKRDRVIYRVIHSE